jgi:hypothetical protein
MDAHVQVFDFWPQSLSGFARKQRAGLGLLVGRWGTPLPRKVRNVHLMLVLCNESVCQVFFALACAV